MDDETEWITPRKINIEPENDGLVQMIFPCPGGPYSHVPAVNLPGCIDLTNYTPVN